MIVYKCRYSIQYVLGIILLTLVSILKAFSTYVTYYVGPPVISLTSSSKGAYTLLPPETNTAKVSGSFGNVVLRTNLIGRWLQPDLSYMTSNSITFVSLNARNQGLYKFYITDWNGNEVLAIKIIIANIGILQVL